MDTVQRQLIQCDRNRKLLLHPLVSVYKKLIRRWDIECELSLRRHRTRITKYNTLMHKFRHRSTRLCVGTHVYQIQWNNAMWRPLRCLRTFKVIDFSTNQKLIYDLLLVCLLILTYLLSCNISKSWLNIAQITLSLGWFPANIAINDISPKTTFFGLHFRYRKYRCTLTVWDIIPKLLSCMLL